MCFVFCIFYFSFENLVGISQGLGPIFFLLPNTRGGEGGNEDGGEP